MRVLLCHQPTDGGVGRHLSDLIEGLASAGHEVAVCSPALPTGVSDAVAHVELDLRRAISPRADSLALARFALTVRRLRPDVIHAHSSKAGALARLARALSPRVPLVYTPHGYAFAGHFSSERERQLYKSIERVLSPLASRVTCVCEAEARLARSVGPAGRVRVVHNGISLPPPGPADARLEQLRRSGPVIGALTQLRPGKGIETLLDAMPLVLAQHAAAQLAIVGDGPDIEQLSGRACELGVSAAVHFLGSSSDPPSALRGMDVFVHPSWAEAFPYVILEAMALARPIVASDVGGIAEAVLDGESGVLTPPREERPLAQALIGLLSDLQGAERLGRSALARMERFTREAMIERLSAVYAEIVRA